jgi:hypothetical protein
LYAVYKQAYLELLERQEYQKVCKIKRKGGRERVYEEGGRSERGVVSEREE